jgi:hypothetical protein
MEGWGRGLMCNEHINYAADKLALTQELSKVTTDSTGLNHIFIVIICCFRSPITISIVSSQGLMGVVEACFVKVHSV